MICKYCSREIPDNVKVCPKCYATAIEAIESKTKPKADAGKDKENGT